MNFENFDRNAYWGAPDTALLGTNLRPAPTFPAQLLGPFWSDWAKRNADASAAPIDYTAAALLTAAGAAIGNVRWPVAGASWSEPPILWCGLVGSPSSGKSPAMDRAFNVIRHAEDAMAAGFDAERDDYETRKAAAEAARDAWKVDVKAAVKEGRSIPSLPAEAREIDEPERPRIRVADATIEKMGALAAALPRGLLLARDEISGWVASFDRYGGSGSDRAFYLEAYGGRSYIVDRIKNPEPIRIRHLSIGVLGTTQPDKLGAITGGADDGLSSRILWVWPDAAPHFSLVREAADERAANHAYSRLTSLSLGSDLYGHPEPVMLKMERAAENALETFARETGARADGAYGPHASALGKARGHVLRLSVVLEFLWWSGDARAAEPTVISEKAVTSACALVAGYFLPMAERVYGDAIIPSEERHAMALIRRVRKGGMRSFNAREIGRQVGGELRKAENMDAACRVLVDGNLIRAKVKDGGGAGRKPKDFETNPIVWPGA